jgi:hypothetical protein
MKAFLAVLLALSAFELTFADDCDCCFPVPEACCGAPQPPCCLSDVVVIIDTTGSIRGGMDNVREFTDNLFAALPIGNCVCTGFMDFSNIPEVKWELGSGQSCAYQGGEGAMLRPPKGQTNTWLALDEARAQFDAAKRPEACQKVALVTDGGSDNKRLTKEAAQALHAAGVDICVLNVGDWREQRENEANAQTNNGANGAQIVPGPGEFVQFEDLGNPTWAEQMAACLCPGDCMKPAP